MKVPVVIVGNGGAAAEAVLALRRSGYSGDVHLFADNDQAPYNPMLGTYLVSGAIPLERAFPFGDKESFYGSNRVTAHLGSGVSVLDALEQTLVTTEGASYEYGRCLVATGARPSLPPVPGLRQLLEPREPVKPGGNAGPDAAKSRRVFTLRSLRDALDLRAALERLGVPAERRGAARRPAARVAVIGASLVGVKLAGFFHDLGLQVCLIEREPHLLPLVAHPDCALMMESCLLDDGYDLRLGASLAEVAPGDDCIRLIFDGGRDPAAEGGASGLGAAGMPAGAARAVEPARSSDDFDLVVVCTGIRPALDFLMPGQVAVDTGIVVDEEMRSNMPTLYAAGDVAQGMNLMSGRHEIIALWASARYQGRAAGRSLAGAHGVYRGSIPSSITHVGHMLFASVGQLRDYDRITTGGTGNAMEIRVWRDGRVVGVNLLDCCLSAGAMKQALQKETVGTTAGSTTGTEASWISFNG